MDKLPVEILNHILTYLHHREKVQCMLVCRRWMARVKKTSLFDTMVVLAMNDLNQLARRFEKDPREAAQVKRLVLDLHFDLHFDLGLFIKHLPNLRLFSCRNKNNSIISSSNTNQPWISRIEQIIDENDRSVVPGLLFLNCQFVYLKSLSIKALDIPVLDFIDLLSRTPALSYLTVKSISITFLELELLHSTLPLLESLTLRIPNPSFNELPYNIEPSPFITSFSLDFDCVAKMDIQKKWFHYIREKYTNMSDFTFRYFLSGWVGIEKEEFYTDWFSPLLEKLGSQLELLSVKSHLIPSNLMEILDNTGCQIKHLKIRSAAPRLLNYFKDSGQLEHLQSFEMEFDTCEIFDWMNKMTSLKELSVFYFDSQVNTRFYLNKLLDTCSGTLESLSLWIKRFEYNDSKVYPSIRNLTFSDCILPLDFDRFLSKSFPNLRYLKFSECHFPENTIMLSKLHLFHFEIEVCRFEQSYDLLVTTLINNEKRLHTFKMGYNSSLYHNSDTGLYRAPFTSVCYKDTTCKPFLTLVCASVCNVSILYKYF